MEYRVQLVSRSNIFPNNRDMKKKMGQHDRSNMARDVLIKLKIVNGNCDNIAR